jgi:hypothetical protein
MESTAWERRIKEIERVTFHHDGEGREPIFSVDEANGTDRSDDRLVSYSSDLHQGDIARDECSREFVKVLPVMGGNQVSTACRFESIHS